MKNDTLYARYLSSRVVEALADTPVELIYGLRQCLRVAASTGIVQLFEGGGEY